MSSSGRLVSLAQHSASCVASMAQAAAEAFLLQLPCHTCSCATIAPSKQLLLVSHSAAGNSAQHT
jgi:hypothetical protein